MSKLAILGGEPVRKRPFPVYNPIGQEEKEAVLEVLDSGVLSGFLGTWDPKFFGGPRIQRFERAWAEAFGVRYAVSVNSATSGLVAAVGAAGVGPGDEVIVSPYTMSASVTCALVYNAVPVFADIDANTFCLDPERILSCVTPRTRAVVVTHLFGQPADMDPIMETARAHNLVVVEDAAQAPMARYNGRLAGALGHMGVFSLNYHKHIHTGEGGVVVTNDENLAERLQLIRNHGESVVAGKRVRELVNAFGFNFRMTEMEAAIGFEQLKKLPGLLAPRIANAEFLADHIGSLPGITPPYVAPGCTHVYYVQPFRFDAAVVGVTRDRFIEAVAVELLSAQPSYPNGPNLSCGYVRPLYLEPLYQKLVAYRHGFPFRGPHYTGEADYHPGLCPVAERMHFHELFEHDLVRPMMTQKDLDDVVRAFEKVYESRHELAAR